MAIPHSVINSMCRSSLAYLRESRHWLPTEMARQDVEYDTDLIHVCNPIHPNTTFSLHDAAKAKNEQPHQKQGYPKEANQCSMGAPVEEQKQMAQKELSRRLE